uniref:Fatty acyl-CoA reductase n=1 Tax=Leersia perrieri TaxID=77586 RepID=A0A0D9W3S9_9ORYZ
MKFLKYCGTARRSGQRREAARRRRTRCEAPRRCAPSPAPVGTTAPPAVRPRLREATALGSRVGEAPVGVLCAKSNSARAKSSLPRAVPPDSAGLPAWRRRAGSAVGDARAVRKASIRRRPPLHGAVRLDPPPADVRAALKDSIRRRPPRMAPPGWVRRRPAPCGAERLELKRQKTVRYDVALATNTAGIMHLCKFAKQCDNLRMLLHVSTAYVAGEQAGLLLEKPFQFGEALRKSYHLDIEAELQLVDRMKSIHRIKFSGDNKAKHFGWPNTYVLTKAMGEMLLEHLGRDLPVVIIRPSMITSTLHDPMPGWIEETRTLDAIFIAYNNQTLPCFIADGNVICDLIPGDMVINAMMVAINSHWNEQAQVIYHVTSAHQNPLPSSLIEISMYNYFHKNPRTTKDGKVIKNKEVLVFKKFSYFQAYMFLRYKVPLEMMHALLRGLYSKNYNKINRGYTILMTMAKLYAPYAFFKGRFDDTNLRKLWNATAMDKNDASLFNFDPNCINWSSYLVNTHIPAAIKYASDSKVKTGSA